MVQHVAAVGDRQGHVDVLLHDQHARACLVGHAPHDRHHALHDDGGQTHAHLVDQQHLGLGHQRPGHGQHLLLAPREQAGAPPAQRRQRGEQLHGAVHGRGATGPVTGEAEAYVLVDGQVEEQRPILGHVGQAAAGGLVGAPTEHGLAEHVDGAHEWAEDARDGEQRGRLAGAVRSEQRHDLARLDVHAETAHHRHAAVAGREVLDRDEPGFDRRRRHTCLRAAAPSWACSSPADSPRYAAITAGLARISAGVPWAMIRPKSST